MSKNCSGARMAIGAVLFVVFGLTLSQRVWSATPTQDFAAGFELLKAGKMAEAAGKFETGLKREPKNAMAQFFLAESYYGLGRRAEAQAAYELSLSLDPNSKVADPARTRLQALKTPAELTPGKVLKDCDVCPEMVVLPPGQFVMGSPPDEVGRYDNEGPVHLVTIAKPFAVGKYEITFDEWDACVADKGCPPAKDEGFGRGRRPVIHVNHMDAVAYAEWLSLKSGKKYRLLSEAEWEYAARAGSTEARYWGNSPYLACQFANVHDQTSKKVNTIFNWEAFDCDDGEAKTAVVGTYKPNAFGLHDMLGNVWEWVADCFNNNYADAPKDGGAWMTGDCGRRVVRGGSWYVGPQYVRSAKRSALAPSDRYNYLGFRVARTLP